MADNPAYPETLRQSFPRLTVHPDRLETDLCCLDAEAGNAKEVMDPHRNEGAIPLVTLTEPSRQPYRLPWQRGPVGNGAEGV